ncbi:ubiquinone/menaquinone biosynthesis methyltransferase [Luteipulveratus halotolerans]|uniref:Demethylmenaquinone methyltransferase n=1 Tax=Luteipulveratus halotolerans TaxID=1631356 RepID=A0A0L6CN44_9MICO|nr:ubiquinone/menaquinone biosynthesis methyltransferase [Luteipulveratus halotolerans]KNX38938.1 hypothetical protein VV01_20275 [Luteipulveratus halotolerans]
MTLPADTTPPDAEQPEPTRVREMFARVAPRYDLANRVMTLGQDRRWRKAIQEHAALPRDGRLLDLATGTGQIAFDALERCPSARIVAADLTSEMLDVARQRPGADRIEWRQLDARELPFDDASFDAVTHGYLLRYLTDDFVGALREQWRVLAPGGRLVALDSSPGKPGLVGRVAAGVTAYWPRLVGSVVAGNARDYEFLQQSTLAFLTPEAVLGRLEEAGFVECGHRSYMQGMLTLFWARKPLDA